MEAKMYSEKEVREAASAYFHNDELATNVFMTKYALKDKEGVYVEKTPSDMHKRLAREFARIEKRFGGNDALSEEKIYSYLKDFKYIVPQGSPMMGIGNNFVNVSLSNCVVVDSPQDTISSIMDSGRELANLFKRRCGVGLDISCLRPENTPVNNSAGTTTGAWSFADFYSYVCRMIGQNGRRGALMITMDVRHPDIEQFIKMKHDLRKVTGANVSVKITDDFMHAVENNNTFALRFPVDSSPTDYHIAKSVEARSLWDLIVDSATKTAEPGLLMWDNITKYLPSDAYEKQGFKTISTNPCAEIPLSAYDSCRLISINLKHFVKNAFEKNAEFDFKKFKEVAKAAMRLSDDLVQLEVEKLKKIIKISDTADEKELWKKLLKACESGRRTGLGTHGLADAIAKLGVRYDSDEAIEMVDKIYKTLKISAYEQSADLATERGSFPAFDWDVEKDNLFIKSLPERIKEKMKKSGRRNIAILTNAPTGSVSILSQTSSGLEPVFRNFYIRRRKLSHNEQEVVPDFVDDLGDKWLEYKVWHHNALEWLIKHDKDVDITPLPAFFITSDQIDWRKRIDIQAAIQKHIDHAISSTINLPKETSPSTVGDLYLEGWKRGLKGITVYVDGARSGVLVDETNKKNKKAAFPQNGAPCRPKELICDIHHTTIKGEKWTILIGLLDDKPYEVLGGLSNLIEIPKKYTSGILTKQHYKTKSNRYDFRFGKNGDEVIVRDIVMVFDNPNHSAFTRMISLGLRHGAPPRLLVEQLIKDKDHDMFSFARCIARILKNYIKDGEEAYSDKSCPECQQGNLVYQDGCVACTTCGYSKCG
jgi:ribonucleoside-diphosphate reductase alpha chain